MTIEHDDPGLVDSVDRLSRVVEHNRRERRLGSIFLGVAILLLLGNGALSTVQNARVLDSQHSSRAVLDLALASSTPEAQARQQERLAAIVGQIITCVENHSDHARDPHVALIANCPQPEAHP